MFAHTEQRSRQRSTDNPDEFIRSHCGDTTHDKRRSQWALLLEAGSSFPLAVVSENFNFCFCRQMIQTLCYLFCKEPWLRGTQINQQLKAATGTENTTKFLRLFWQPNISCRKNKSVEVKTGQCSVFLQLLPGYTWAHCPQHRRRTSVQTVRQVSWLPLVVCSKTNTHTQTTHTHKP